MGNSLADLADNLADGIHKIKCKHRHITIKNVKNRKLNTKIANAILNIQMLKIIR